MMNPNPGNAVHPNQILVSSQQQQKQGFVNNHGHGGQQVAMDAYGRPVHNPSKVPASATNTMANMGRSSSGGSQPQQPHQGHHQQRPQNQQQHHQQQQQRNMSLPYSQPQQKSSRSSQQQHRHSSGKPLVYITYMIIPIKEKIAIVLSRFARQTCTESLTELLCCAVYSLSQYKFVWRNGAIQWLSFL